MVWAIQYCDDSVAVLEAGIFIPRSEITGLIANSELASENKERKVAYGLCNSIYEALAANTNKLGLAASRPALVGAGESRVNQTYTLTAQFVVNHAASSVGVVPLPGSGVGKVSLRSIFPSAQGLAAEASTPSAGVVIPHTLITDFGGTLPGNLDTGDQRDWIVALYLSMLSQLEPNSALVAAARGNAVGLAFPANFTGANAITGLVAADLPLRSLFSTVFTFTFQLLLNQGTQEFDLAA